MTAPPRFLTDTPPHAPGAGDEAVVTPVASPTALDDALDRLQLSGAIFFRSEFTEPWAYESVAAPRLAAALRTGSDRVIVFHIVDRGRCWVSIGDGDRHRAEAGDVIVLPYGDQHVMGGDEPADSVSILSLIDMPPWPNLPSIRYGAGGPQTDIVCGYLHSDDPLFDPVMAALPRVFVVRPPAGPAAEWVRSSVDYALMTAASGERPAFTRLPEALLVEVLRLHLATAPAADHGWLAALRDPVLAPALARVHAEPDRRWTVAELASSAAVSRSLLDERFRLLLGRSPIRYLAEWRMHLATELLASTDLAVAEVALRVGYRAEEAFSRAFKRRYGRSPSDRRGRRGTNPRKVARDRRSARPADPSPRR